MFSETLGFVFEDVLAHPEPERIIIDLSKVPKLGATE